MISWLRVNAGEWIMQYGRWTNQENSSGFISAAADTEGWNTQSFQLFRVKFARHILSSESDFPVFMVLKSKKKKKRIQQLFCPAAIKVGFLKLTKNCIIRHTNVLFEKVYADAIKGIKSNKDTFKIGLWHAQAHFDCSEGQLVLWWRHSEVHLFLCPPALVLCLSYFPGISWHTGVKGHLLPCLPASMPHCAWFLL